MEKKSPKFVHTNLYLSSQFYLFVAEEIRHAKTYMGMVEVSISEQKLKLQSLLFSNLHNTRLIQVFCFSLDFQFSLQSQDDPSPDQRLPGRHIALLESN